MLPDSQYRDLLELRVSSPAQFQSRLADRARPSSLLPEDGKLFLIAADHPARGANAVGNDPLAMANRQDLLRRLLITLADPGCDGIMGSPDILEELAVLGALENKVVVGTMNRGGLAGAEWGLDDRHTAYSAQQIAKAKLDGGKMLLRIHDTDPGTKNTLGAVRPIRQRACRPAGHGHGRARCRLGPTTPNCWSGVLGSPMRWGIRRRTRG